MDAGGKGGNLQPTSSPQRPHRPMGAARVQPRAHQIPQGELNTIMCCLEIRNVGDRMSVTLRLECPAYAVATFDPLAFEISVSVVSEPVDAYARRSAQR